MKFKNILEKVCEKKDLSEKEAEFAFKSIMTGQINDIQIAGFLTSLSTKGETTTEILSAIKVLRKKAKLINTRLSIFDTCGTGGDGKNTLNISTAVAILSSACGVKIAKHGNKSVSSKSGSSDVLSELGVNIFASKKVVQNCLKRNGLCFLMAPLYHSAMKNVANARANLQIKTIFNILGPLINPANAKKQLIGVYSKDWMDRIAECIKKLKMKKVWVVNGTDGLDEITTTGITNVIEVIGNKIRKFEINPKELGIEPSSLKDLKGGTPKHNAKMITRLFKGELKNKPYEDIVLLNTAAVLNIDGHCKTLTEGLNLSRKFIENGNALEKLNEFAKSSNQ